MNAALDYLLDQASEGQIARHLALCDAHFVRSLSARVELTAYAQKITNHASRFEAWQADVLVGLLAAYCNDRHSGIAYITSVSVLTGYGGSGIGTRLLEQCINHAQSAGMRQISLEVGSTNAVAIGLYKKNGFRATEASEDKGFISMHLDLNMNAGNS